jgi:hypothetical protein
MAREESPCIFMPDGAEDGLWNPGLT